MSASLSPKSFLDEPSPIPFYAESPETSRQLFKAATTPSPTTPRITRHRQEAGRSSSPIPEESRSVQNSNSPSRVVEVEDDDDSIFAPAKNIKHDVPSGFGLGLGIPVLPDEYGDEPPVIAWRFSEVSKQSSVVSPGSPSPTESVVGDGGPPGGDQYSIHTLTPGPAWPPPPSTIVSPEPTPRNSMDVEQNRGSGGSGDFEGMPMSPLTPAITQLLDEISTMERPPSSNTSKTVTTVQAWVMDMPKMETNRDRSQIRVRKMRSWRNLRALGTRTSQFELLRKAADSQTLPSPPITPPGPGSADVVQQEAVQEEQQALFGLVQKSTQLPDSPIEIPFYDDYEDFIEEHLDLAAEAGEASEHVEQDRSAPVEETDAEVEDPDMTPRPPQLEPLELEAIEVPRHQAPESPEAPQGLVDPMTPDPNSDLVGEIEALLQSSPLRKKEREDEERAASNQSTPTQAMIAAGTTVDPDHTPTQIHPPIFARNPTQETITSQATESDVFYTPKEGRTPFVEHPDPFEAEPIPPLPLNHEARPQTPPPKPSSTHSTPTRPPIPVRRSSLSHSRNHSVETIPTKSYPPTSHRPGAHIRGKSIDSSTLSSDRGRIYPPPSRQRSSSANAVPDEVRGRGRSRSIDDGPPPIPVRRSSVGKTGKPSQLIDGWPRKDSNDSARRPSLGSASGSRQVSDESMERKNSNRFSFSSGVEILGVEEKAEIVNAGVVPSGSVREVLVRTGSKGTKASEFSDSSATSPPTEKRKPEFTPHHIPQFSFGEGPDLSFGESSASSGKGKGRAADQSQGSPTSLPVLFHLIPPTPAAVDGSAADSKQLGFVPIQIPATPKPDEPITAPYRQPTPVNTVYFKSATESTPSIPLPGRLHSVAAEVTDRPSTAPEPLIDFENTMPSIDPPKRPSLKNRPTGFKKSKLSPWWRPKYEQYHHHNQDFDDGFDYLSHTHSNGSARPGTSGTITTITSTSGTGSGKKSHKTVNLGKFQLEFVGVRGLRENYREMKEQKKRRKLLAQRQADLEKLQKRIQQEQMAEGYVEGPPRLELSFN
ncbi:hypothetical protein ABW19_dt0201832 [Dactylella cylindrospora]|nr:hypothetical protein ABW19_dt0201832 [Dactylella cylindrospora]